jgi:peptide/nickel transport system substrate-binding protein
MSRTAMSRQVSQLRSEPRARFAGRGFWVKAAVAVVAATLALSACGGSGSGTSVQKSSSSSLVVASAGLPSTFVIDGAAPAGYENLEFGVNTMAGLVRQPYVADPASGGLEQNLYKFEPVLAKSYTVSADHLTYTFTLKHGVKSVAGNPFTADDVVYSWQRKFKAPTSITPFVQDPVITDPDKQLKKIDDYTVAFTVAKPGYGFTLLSLLANVTGYIYDSKLLKEHATATDLYAVNWSQQNPNIGYGAYQRTSFTPGSQMVLTANPNYVLTAPAYKKITFRVAADAGTRANTVSNGDADIAVQLRPADQLTLAKSKNAKVYSFPATNMLTMFTMNTTLPPFNNQQVREAVAYAVPYDKILSNVYQGRAILTKGLLDPRAPNYSDAGLRAPTYDPAKAKAMLAAAGFPNGVSFKLTVSSTVPDVQDSAIQFQSYAAAAGVKITIDQQPAASFGAGITSRKWDAFMWRDMAISSSPQYELGLFFKKAAGKAAGTNSSGWVNDKYLAAIDMGAALPDPTTPQAGKYWNLAERMTSTADPQIYIGRIQPSNAFRVGISGYANRLDNDIDFSMLKPAA